MVGVVADVTCARLTGGPRAWHRLQVDRVRIRVPGGSGSSCTGDRDVVGSFCTEHGARLGRSRLWGLYAEAARRRRNVRGGGGRKRHRLGVFLFGVRHAAVRSACECSRSQPWTNCRSSLLRSSAAPGLLMGTEGSDVPHPRCRALSPSLQGGVETHFPQFLRRYGLYEYLFMYGCAPVGHFQQCPRVTGRAQVRVPVSYPRGVGCSQNTQRERWTRLNTVSP
jgi:hypothetical protein